MSEENEELENEKDTDLEDEELENEEDTDLEDDDDGEDLEDDLEDDEDDLEDDDDGEDDLEDDEDDLEDDDEDFDDDDEDDDGSEDPLEGLSDEEIESLSAEELEALIAGEDFQQEPQQQNLTYKVNGVENPFPEWAQGLVTDEESENQFREILEKQGAFDSIKAQRDTYKQSHDNFNQVQQNLAQVAHFVRQGDIDSAIQTIGIDQKTIEDWIERKNELASLSYEEQQAYKQNSDLNRQNYQLQQQLENQQKMAHEQSVNQTMMELDSYIGNHQNKEAINYFNQQMGGGNPLYFKDAVINFAQSMANQQNRNISVAEAVDTMLNFYTGTPNYQSQVGQGRPQNQIQTQSQGLPQNVSSKPRAKRKLPVIPTVPRGSNSAVKESKISSIADIKKAAQGLARR